MAQKLSEADRIRFEFTWANNALHAANVGDDEAIWQDLRHGSRMFVYPDKLLIAWSPDDTESGVTIHHVYRVTGLDIHFDHGLCLVLTDRDGNVTRVSHTPTRLEGLDIFLWMPSFNEVRFTPKDWFKPQRPTQLRIGLNFKQARSLAGDPEVGCHYFSELVDFRRRFPHLSYQRF